MYVSLVSLQFLNLSITLEKLKVTNRVRNDWCNFTNHHGYYSGIFLSCCNHEHETKQALNILTTLSLTSKMSNSLSQSLVDEINKHLTKAWHSYFGPDKILKKNGILIIDTLQSFCFRYKIESIILFTIWYSFQSRIRYILLHLWVSWQWIYVLKTGRWYMGKWKTFSLSK